MVRQMMFCVSLLMAVNCLGQTTNKARQGYEQFKNRKRLSAKQNRILSL